MDANVVRITVKFINKMVSLKIKEDTTLGRLIEILHKQYNYQQDKSTLAARFRGETLPSDMTISELIYEKNYQETEKIEIDSNTGNAIPITSAIMSGSYSRVHGDPKTNITNMLSKGGREFDRGIAQILIETKVLAKDEADSALQTASLQSKSLIATLVEESYLQERDILTAVSRYLKIPSIELENMAIAPEVLDIIPKNVAEYYTIMPVRFDGVKITVALVNPFNEQNLQDLKLVTGHTIEPMLSTERSIKAKINSVYQKKDLPPTKETPIKAGRAETAKPTVVSSPLLAPTVAIPPKLGVPVTGGMRGVTPSSNAKGNPLLDKTETLDQQAFLDMNRGVTANKPVPPSGPASTIAKSSMPATKSKPVPQIDLANPQEEPQFEIPAEPLDMAAFSLPKSPPALQRPTTGKVVIKDGERITEDKINPDEYIVPTICEDKDGDWGTPTPDLAPHAQPSPNAEIWNSATQASDKAGDIEEKDHPSDHLMDAFPLISEGEPPQALSVMPTIEPNPALPDAMPLPDAEPMPDAEPVPDAEPMPDAEPVPDAEPFADTESPKANDPMLEPDLDHDITLPPVPPEPASQQFAPTSAEKAVEQKPGTSKMSKESGLDIHIDPESHIAITAEEQELERLMRDENAELPNINQPIMPDMEQDEGITTEKPVSKDGIFASSDLIQTQKFPVVPKSTPSSHEDLLFPDDERLMPKTDALEQMGGETAPASAKIEVTPPSTPEIPSTLERPIPLSPTAPTPAGLSAMSKDQDMAKGEAVTVTNGEELSTPDFDQLAPLPNPPLQEAQPEIAPIAVDNIPAPLPPTSQQTSPATAADIDSKVTPLAVPAQGQPASVTAAASTSTATASPEPKPADATAASAPGNAPVLSALASLVASYSDDDVSKKAVPTNMPESVATPAAEEERARRVTEAHPTPPTTGVSTAKPSDEVAEPIKGITTKPKTTLVKPMGMRPKITRETLVRYFEKMYPFVTYPMEVLFTEQRITEIKAKMSQTPGRPVSVTSAQPVVKVVPQMPGCLTVPPEIALDITPTETMAKFWLTPLSQGKLEGAHVQVWHEGQCIERIEIQAKVGVPTVAKITAMLGFLIPILSFIWDIAGEMLMENYPNLLPWVEMIQDVLQPAIEMIGGMLPFIGLMAGSMLFLAMLFYFATKSRWGRPAQERITV